MTTDQRVMTTQLSQANTRQRRKVKRRRLVSSLLTHAAIWVLLFFAIFPFYWALVSTLKPFDQLYTLTPTFWPTQITFANFQALLNQSVFVETLRNSIIVAVLTP